MNCGGGYCAAPLGNSPAAVDGDWHSRTALIGGVSAATILLAMLVGMAYWVCCGRYRRMRKEHHRQHCGNEAQYYAHKHQLHALIEPDMTQHTMFVHENGLSTLKKIPYGAYDTR
jgi:hypothetical protein